MVSRVGARCVDGIRDGDRVERSRGRVWGGKTDMGRRERRWGGWGGWGMAQREVFTGEGVHTKLARKAFQLRRSRGLHGSCDGTAG